MGLETVRGRRTATIPGRFIIETSFGEEFVRWFVRSFGGPVVVSLVKRIASRSIVCWLVDAVGACPGEGVVRRNKRFHVHGLAVAAKANVKLILAQAPQSQHGPREDRAHHQNYSAVS